MRLRLAALLLCLLSGTAAAHEVRPAYLRISELPGGTYDLLWRVPVGGEVQLVVDVLMPENCTSAGEPRIWTASGTRNTSSRVRCADGLAGNSVGIDGLRAGITDALVRFERADGTTQIVRLTPTSPAFVVTAAETGWQVASTYTWLGVEHILLGIDHLLFVLALLMIVSGWRRLVATVTAFTLAHSITLGGATLGLVRLPQQPVEAVIALSIVFVCLEIVHWKQGRPGMARRWPWLVAFVFGLLHGFGFAGALTEIGLPDHAIPLALLFFNVGVEIGQLLFVAVVFASWALLRRVSWPAWAWRLPVYGIGGLAGFWTIERIAGFL